MDIRSLKAAAAQSLAESTYDPKKLALLHTGAALLLSLVLTLLNYLLTRSIDNTAGLAGIGTRSILTSAQSLLSIVGNIALPFWEIGFLFAALSMARKESVGPAHLLEGFRRFRAVLRLLLLQTLLYTGVAMGCFYAATTIFVFTPLSNGMAEAVEGLLSGTDAAALAQQSDMIAEAVMPYMIPLYVIFGILLLVVAVPLFYRFRMAQFALMDQDAAGARAAMKASSRMTRKKRLFLFKLDLSFWWFYGAQVLILVIAFGDALLKLIGIALPVSDDAAMFLFFGAQLLLQLALAWYCGSYVQTTYAHCYDMLKQDAPPLPSPANQMKNLPWV